MRKTRIARTWPMPQWAAGKNVAVGLLIAALLAVLGLPLTSCGGERTEQGFDEVTVQLKWVHQAQFAGFYVAQEKGYYEEEGLDVTLLEAGPGVNIGERVVAGEADFGIGAPENILIQRSQGKPLVAIATIYRRNPTVFVALEGSGIERPSDLLDRRVAVLGDVAFEPQFLAMVNRLDLDKDRIEMVDHSYDLTPLYDGEIDCIAVYATGGLIRAREAGYELNLIWPSDYGIHTYADTLIATEQTVEERPDLAVRFLRATLRGWQEAVGNPEEAVDVTMSYAEEADRELQLKMMEASLPLVHTGENQIGWMEGEVWQTMVGMLREQGILEQPVAVDQVYTTRFLRDIYGDDQ